MRTYISRDVCMGPALQVHLLPYSSKGKLWRWRKQKQKQRGGLCGVWLGACFPVTRMARSTLDNVKSEDYTSQGGSSDGFTLGFRTFTPQKDRDFID